MDKLKIVKSRPTLGHVILEKWVVSYGSETVTILCTHRLKWVVYYKGKPYRVDGFLSAQLKAMELLNVRTKD